MRIIKVIVKDDLQEWPEEFDLRVPQSPDIMVSSNIIKLRDGSSIQVTHHKTLKTLLAKAR